MALKCAVSEAHQPTQPPTMGAGGGRGPSPKPTQAPEPKGKARPRLYDAPPLPVSRAEQEAARSPRGGGPERQLASWGLHGPPPLAGDSARPTACRSQPLPPFPDPDGARSGALTGYRERDHYRAPLNAVCALVFNRKANEGDRRRRKGSRSPAILALCRGRSHPARTESDPRILGFLDRRQLGSEPVTNSCGTIAMTHR